LHFRFAAEQFGNFADIVQNFIETLPLCVNAHILERMRGKPTVFGLFDTTW
jgi:hypothetical protein